MDDILKESLEKAGIENLVIDTSNEETNTVEEFASDIGRKSEDIKKELDTLSIASNNLVFAFEGFDGEPLAPREETGTYFIDMLDIDKVAFAGSQENQIRKGDLNIFEIQQSIEKVGQLEPIHVVPFGRIIDTSSGLPKYAKYLILSGRRRYEAIRALGQSSILAIVNTTVSNQLIELYSGIAQNTKSYRFSEMVDYSNRIKLEQRSMSVETLENFLGFKSGEFLKSLYIEQMQNDYPDVYAQVEKGKLSIEQAFKRLEKEIEKAEKAEMEGEMSGDDVEDALRDKSGDDLTELQIDNTTQELGNRHILDANLRRSVESRDSGTCQACGFGEGEDDLMGGFNAHHIIPVMYQGQDAKDNLILLCLNCHGFVHKYETGNFSPDKTTYERLIWVQKVVVLGNMLRKLRTFSIKEIARKDPNTHRMLQKGAISLGKAIVKSKIDIDGMSMFNNNPYQTFMDAFENLGEFSSLETFEEDPTTEPSEDVGEHNPRLLSKEQVIAMTSEEVKANDEKLGLVETVEDDLETLSENEVTEEDEENNLDLFDLLEDEESEVVEKESVDSMDSDDSEVLNNQEQEQTEELTEVEETPDVQEEEVEISEPEDEGEYATEIEEYMKYLRKPE